MAVKTANITARVQPEITQQAESVLGQLGIPVSVLIDSLYRQIIMTTGIPYAISIPASPTADTMTRPQFDAMLQIGLSQAKSGEGLDLDDAFAQIDAQI